MIDPEHPEPGAEPGKRVDSAPLGPETEADVHEHAVRDVDPDDMFDPLGT